MGVEDLGGKVDLVFAFAVVHEMPNVPAFFAEARRALRPGGRVLLVEPRGHVDERAFRVRIEAAQRAGLTAGEGTEIARSRTAVLVQ